MSVLEPMSGTRSGLDGRSPASLNRTTRSCESTCRPCLLPMSVLAGPTTAMVFPLTRREKEGSVSRTGHRTIIRGLAGHSVKGGGIMLRKSLIGATLVAAMVWVGSAQDAQTVIASASKAIGVDALKTVQYSATGMDFALGQAPNPSSPWPKFINKSYTRAINFETPASKVDRVRVQGENPPRGGGQQPIVGEQPQSQTIIVAADTPWPQQLEIWMMPHGFLRAAATKNATVESKTVAGKKYQVVTFTGDNK